MTSRRGRAEAGFAGAARGAEPPPRGHPPLFKGGGEGYSIEKYGLEDRNP